MSKPLFEKFADDFAASRPEYPEEIKRSLFSLFSIKNGSVIADIACGSGLFTQSLSCKDRNRTVIGVDHSMPLLRAGMRFFGNYCFEPLCATGESLSFNSGSFDLVTVAQGFHWMNRQKSLSEISRILKPGGGIALIWYRRSTLTSPHQEFIEKLTYQYNPNYDPKFMDADYVGMLVKNGGYTDIGQKRFYGSKTYDLPTYIRWQRSKSFIGDAMDENMLEEFLQKVETAMQQYFPDGIITEDFKYDLIYGRKK
ncbi:MAG: methyltransferase domain-containing protein [candidate division Zixibacteria bacterium]